MTLLVMEPYVGLVQAYVREGQEADLAAIGALREALVSNHVPIEDLVGLHERAMLTLKDTITRENFEAVVIKTSTCFTELALAYSLADDKKKSMRDHEQRNAREQQRLEALGQMAGGVAHEFKNLLQPIMGMTEMALADSDPSSELSSQLEVILDCAKQARSIVHGILTSARKQTSEPRPTAFATAVREAVKFVSVILPRALEISLSVSCADELILCDEGELRQVLLNLARNAGAAMGGKGSIRIQLTLEKREHEDASERYLRLVVADDGAGMPEDIAARAFQPFFTTKAATEGTGLGLSIVMAIAHGWNGKIELETAPGAGTRVSVILPVIGEADVSRSAAS
jgi:signal transduction histidine kinase